MTSFRVRPRFKQISPLKIEQLLKNINQKLNSTTEPIDGKVFKTHGLFRITPEQQHYWSPQLNISFEETDEGTVIRGMYGPHPSVWAVFLFGYAVLGLAFLVVTIWGLVKLNLHLDYSILWALPIIAGAIVLLYFSAQTGQKMGVEQTFTLHHFYEDAVGEKVHIH